MSSGPDPDKFDEVVQSESASAVRKLWVGILVALAIVIGSAFVLSPELVVGVFSGFVEDDTGATGAEYTGTWQGSFGPTVGAGPSSRSMDGDVTASVNFETGVITGTIQGENSEGSFSGNVSGRSVSGEGELGAFELINIDITFEGTVSPDNSTIRGTWQSKSGSASSGTWEVHAVGNASASG